MENCKPIKTPLNTNEKLCLNDGGDKINEKYFRSIVGSLMYLTHTRPDIAFAVSLISRFMYKPSKFHLGTAKRILRYVQGTLNFGIRYSKGKSNKLVAFTDSDWASCTDDRKSTTGYMLSLGLGVISWSSKKQHSIALSSTEAEYAAATTTACQVVWLRRILEDLKQEHGEATVIFCDKKSTIALSKNPVHQRRTKHIETKHHFIRDLVSRGIVELQYINTEEQPTNIFTKALSEAKFAKFRSIMRVEPFLELRGGNVGN